ncbi:MAG: glycosyltransferase 87 family protein [Solirubrobacteraceae bacterium]
MSSDGPLAGTSQTASYEFTAPSRAHSHTRARLGSIGLGGVVLTTFVVCISAARTDALLPESVRPVPAWLAGPFGSSGLRLSVGELIAVLSLMFASYVLVMRTADRLPARQVLMAIAALSALVLLAPPLLSTDVFSYQAYARMWATYSANPYLSGPHVIALDPLYPFIGAKWVNTPTSYGPLFTLLSVLLANASIAASALAFKAIAALASLATVALLWNAARLRGLNPVRAVALFGLNPLVVVYGVGGGHNDLLMLSFTTAGIYMVLSRRERTSGAIIMIGIAIKLTGALVLPFALASGSGLGSHKHRRSILAGASIAAAAIAAIGFAAFGVGQLNLIGTLRTVQGEGDWHSIPGFISTRLGLGTIGQATGLLFGLAFVGVSCWLARRVWRGEMDWIDGAGWATLAMLLSASSLLPWYVAWLLPLVALCTDRRLWPIAVTLTGVVQFITMLGYIPHGSTVLGL